MSHDIDPMSPSRPASFPRHFLMYWEFATVENNAFVRSCGREQPSGVIWEKSVSVGVYLELATVENNAFEILRPRTTTGPRLGEIPGRSPSVAVGVYLEFAVLESSAFEILWPRTPVGSHLGKIPKGSPLQPLVCIWTLPL